MYDLDVLINASDIVPTVTWGTSPQDVVPITGVVPSPGDFHGQAKQDSCQNALEYMGLVPGMRMEDIMLDKVFIGSCTNARIEDLRAAANIVRGKTIAKNLKRAMIVPGSGLVKQQAEAEELDKVFTDAGFEWREAGCSMCLGMNPDILSPKERCASTSNRNFEGMISISIHSVVGKISMAKTALGIHARHSSYNSSVLSHQEKLSRIIT